MSQSKSQGFVRYVAHAGGDFTVFR
jgi:hypothetical protein